MLNPLDDTESFKSGGAYADLRYSSLGNTIVFSDS